MGESKGTLQHPKSLGFRAVNTVLKYAGPSVSTGKEAFRQPSAAMLTLFYSFSLFLFTLPLMSSASILSQPFYYFHFFSLQQNYFSLATFTILIISLVTFDLSFEPFPHPFSLYLPSLPFLWKVHCSGHASSLPTRHGTELLPACGPHDYGSLGAGLCRVLPSPLWLQHHR